VGPENYVLRPQVWIVATARRQAALGLDCAGSVLLRQQRRERDAERTSSLGRGGDEGGQLVNRHAAIRQDAEHGLKRVRHVAGSRT